MKAKKVKKPSKHVGLYCKDCENDTRFGYFEEMDYEVKSDDPREVCESNLVQINSYYYCQICKKTIQNV